MHLSTDVLVIGAGGAGMYAAIAAARAGARVALLDKSMIGRGGATVMAQMTVAAALGEEEPDRWQDHLRDTISAGRGLVDASIAEALCRDAPERIREMDRWGVGWARSGHRIRQVHAPGHGARRCCYVDFLNTGPAVAGTLRKVLGKASDVERISNVQVVDLVRRDERVCGALAVSLDDGAELSVSARSTVIATGGLTKLYARSSASANMVGEGYALALRAGARLRDMEFVQFFPIGHLAPRLVGMDPIMWDPFRYKLGGRLLNGAMEEFIDRYGAEDGGTYRVTRDVATYAICREVAAGRGSPAGGAYLSFTHVPDAALREAFGPVIDRLLANGIDLTRAAVEVAPIAHYHMGGIEVDAEMATAVPGLFAAGEAVGGAGGANRLSGNAISEALVFGERAGRAAARHARSMPSAHDPREASSTRTARPRASGAAAAGTPAVARLREVRDLMWRDVGPFRTREGLEHALEWIRRERSALDDTDPPRPAPYANESMDWYDLRAALLCAEAVTVAALARRESRGAHQRDDFPHADRALEVSQSVELDDGRIVCSADSRLPGAAA